MSIKREVQHGREPGGRSPTSSRPCLRRGDPLGRFVGDRGKRSTKGFLDLARPCRAWKLHPRLSDEVIHEAQSLQDAPGRGRTGGHRRGQRLPYRTRSTAYAVGQVTLDAGLRRNHTKWALESWQFNLATIFRCLQLLLPADLVEPMPPVPPHLSWLRCFRQAVIRRSALSTISCARSSSSTTRPLWLSGLTMSAINAGTAMSTVLTLRQLSLDGTAESIHPDRGSSARVVASIS